MEQEIKIIQVTEEYGIIKELFLEYAEWLNFDLCFQGFENELQNLDKVYENPGGCLLLAYAGCNVAGCVALRKISDDVCEMKRLFVREKYRGLKIGRMLSNRIIEIAKEKGYGKMKLDTLERMKAAVQLYRSIGFKETQPYRPNPMSDVIYMELEIR